MPPEVEELDLSRSGFRIGEWRVEPSLNRLVRGDTTIQLELKVMDVLVCLARRAGGVVSRRELTDAVWATEFICDNTVSHAVAELRGALGDDAKQPRYIETIHRRGYRLMVAVEEVGGEEPAESKVARFPAAARPMSTEDERGPYPGLSAFTEEDAESFVGREAEVAQMWRRLTSRRLLAVIGPSGVGKSSFLRAGVIPARPEGWGAVVCQPGERPFGSLARALVPEFGDDTDAVARLVGIRDPGEMVAIVSRWRERHEQALLVVDQFEELFTQNPPEAQAGFAGFLRKLVDDADVHVVVAMRDDFLYRCQSIGSLHAVLDGLFALEQPSSESLKRALVEPARRLRYAFEDDQLAGEMAAEVAGERGALPMLAFAVARLWEKRDRGRRLLTRQAYAEIGKVGGALAKHAEATLTALGDENLPIVRELFRNLVTAEGTRAVREWDELLSVFGGEPQPLSFRASAASRGIPGSRERQQGPAISARAGDPSTRASDALAQDDRSAAAEAVLRQLIDARLLTSYEVREEDREPTRRVEIIHESLLANWPRLVRWQTQDADAAQLRDQLRQAARTWHEHGRTDDMLWTGSAYREFSVWRERYPGGLSELEEAFASAMNSLATRRKRRRRIVVAASFAVLLAVLAVVGTLWRRSVLETRRAEASKLLALGQLHLEDHPNAALAYAVASLESTDTGAARQFAVQALWQGPPALFMSGSLSPIFFHWSPDGRWLAVNNRMRSGITVLDRDTPRQSRVPGSEYLIGFTADSRELLTVPWDGVTRSLNVWSLPAAELSRTIEFPSPGWPVPLGDRAVILDPMPPEADRPVSVHRISLAGDGGEFLGDWLPRGLSGFALDPTATWIASVQQGQVVRQQLDELAAPPRALGSHAGNVRIAAQPWRDRIVTGDDVGEIRIWDVVEDRLVRTLVSPADARGLVLDPRGRFLAAGPTDDQGGMMTRRSLFVFDLEAPPGAVPTPLLNSDFVALTAWEFGPDGSWLGSAHGGTGALWNLAARRSVLLGTQQGPLLGVAFSPDGRLVTTSDAGAVKVWPIAARARENVRELLSLPFGSQIGGDMAVDPRGRFVVVAERVTDRLHIVPLDGSPPRVHRFSGTPGIEHWVSDPQIDPSGRYVAITYMERQNLAANSVRVLDLETGFEPTLNTHPEGEARCTVEGPVLEGIWPSVWLADGRLVSDGDMGLRIWDLEVGTSELLRPCTNGLNIPWVLATPDGLEFVRLQKQGTLNTGEWTALTVFHRPTGEIRGITTHGNTLTCAALDPSGRILVTGDREGVVRVGSLGGEDPHLLYGHSGAVLRVAVSPDGRWVASSSQDETLRLWPMPDLSKPPLHTMPHAELLAKLKSLTNLRAVRDPESSTGWKIEVGPFPGWATVPEW